MHVNTTANDCDIVSPLPSDRYTGAITEQDMVVILVAYKHISKLSQQALATMVSDRWVLHC